MEEAARSEIDLWDMTQQGWVACSDVCFGCCAMELGANSVIGKPWTAMPEQEPTMGVATSEGAGVSQMSLRKSRRSPQKARKLLVSPDSAAQANGENYSYGDPRVEPLSQLSDIVAMEEPPREDELRGPMDEMRQLVRILVKVIPHSGHLITTGDEGGGGNRISEEQIKAYLDNTLGEGPRPTWGVPGGWGEFLSELFTWALDTPITREQAMRCAKREPGRSWEAIERELHKLGVRSETWILPLTRAGMAQARSQHLELSPSAEPDDQERLALPAKRKAPMGSEGELDYEMNIWRQLKSLITQARKNVTFPRAGEAQGNELQALTALRQEVVRDLQLLASACGIPWTHVGDPIPAFAPHHNPHQQQQQQQAPQGPTPSMLPSLSPLEHMPASQAQLIWMPQPGARNAAVANGVIRGGLQGGGSGSAFTALGPSNAGAALEQHQLDLAAPFGEASPSNYLLSQPLGGAASGLDQRASQGSLLAASEALKMISSPARSVGTDAGRDGSQKGTPSRAHSLQMSLLLNGSHTSGLGDGSEGSSQGQLLHPVALSPAYLLHSASQDHQGCTLLPQAEALCQPPASQDDLDSFRMFPSSRRVTAAASSPHFHGPPATRQGPPASPSHRKTKARADADRGLQQDGSQQAEAPGTTRTAPEPANPAAAGSQVQALPALQAFHVPSTSGGPVNGFVAIPAAQFAQHLQALQVQGVSGAEQQYIMVSSAGLPLSHGADPLQQAHHTFDSQDPHADSPHAASPPLHQDTVSLADAGRSQSQPPPPTSGHSARPIPGRLSLSAALK
ncbi:hypothetical protein WJX73_006847 [Symbiochloris irregularis]|uniref:Uncharacterized protein n=1 Tax=Symbiochloris irregularis TaxID=706552 RepID=A0AAW1NSR8_9CHLO